MAVRGMDAYKGDSLVYDTAWLGNIPSSITGTDNVVGATRTYDFSINNTAVSLTEVVHSSPPSLQHWQDLAEWF